MRLLDRLFGELRYPLDFLLPSATWLAACALAGTAAVLWARRRDLGGVRTGIGIALGVAAVNMLVWTAFVTLRALSGDAPLAWQPAVEAPFAALRRAYGEVLWQVAGVASAVEPAELFRGYSSWNGDWSVLVAGLLNESAALGMLALAIAAALLWRRSRAKLLAEAGLHMQAGRWPAAAALLRRALAVEPMDAAAWNRLGFACKELGDLQEAARCFRRCADLAPQSAGALCNVASAARDMGRVDEALEMLGRARGLAPDDLDVLSAYLFTLNLTSRISREESFRAHLECERILGDTPRLTLAPRAAGKKLRIGYVSPDLRLHAVACFVEPVLRHHDRSRFEAVCYHLHPVQDAMTRRLMALADGWVNCARWPAADLARRIAADGVDILVDLAGHTDWNALRALAMKPAPVIATWLGYLNTTGLRAVDYRITDRYTDPPGLTERFHTEKLARLPESQWCRQKPESALAVSPLPARQPGALRLGSFNKSSKLTRATVELWAGILRRLPESRLLLVGLLPRQRDDLVERFTALGIESSRLDFAGRVSLDEFRRLHHGVDIALDAFPYSGATTTLDSLWMGVPTLTLAGEGPMSRSSASILAALGLAQWIARSPAEIIELAEYHANDLSGLASLRAGLRQKLEASVLMDGERFTPQLEALYLEMWRELSAGRAASRATS